MACWSGRVRGLVWLAMTAAALVTCQTVRLLHPPVENDPDRLWRSIEADLQNGRIGAAEASIDRLFQLRPATEDQAFALGQLAMGRGRNALALDVLALVGDTHPMAAKARTFQGSIELKNQRARHAENALLRAVDLDPRDPAPHRQLVVLYCMQRRRRALSDQFLALSRLTPLGFDDMVLWGTSLAALWDPSEVQSILEGFVKADPDDRSSRLALAEALRRLRRESDVETVLSYLPDADPEARAIRARMALDRGEIGEVERLLNEKSDEHPALARFRARLALGRRDQKTACEQLRLALVDDPHNRSILLLLGDTLIKSGHVEDGRRYQSIAKGHDTLFELLEQASGPRGRTDARLLEKIARASLNLELRAQAKAWYLLALEVDPASQETQQAVYRLEHEESSETAESPIEVIMPGPALLARPRTAAEAS